MYIQKAKIRNIKSIVDFEIEFPNLAGWHVLIGDNGSGKSTIIRSIALALVGHFQALGLRANWNDWVNRNSSNGQIELEFIVDEEFDIFPQTLSPQPHLIVSKMNLNKNGYYDSAYGFSSLEDHVEVSIEEGLSGLFSVAYGPHRRFEGGNSEWDDLFKNPGFTNLAAHLSVFDESVALTEVISWLKNLQYKSLEEDAESRKILKYLRKLVNSDNFLPHDSKLESVSSDGVFFKDANGSTISVNQMSDGYRSILSMTFDLIRQLVRVYGSQKVFRIMEYTGEIFIDMPGVVLVDEIDAHLHPTWQTRIGQWFLKYFPKLQFIVTTHSPLVCRAAEKGSIWRLAAPGSDEKSGEITGIDRDRLIYGNVLDAYGTEVFGGNVAISEDSNEMLNRLAELNIKSMMGEIDESEHSELENLKAILPTESKL